jgi:hypothetical protein
VAINKTDLAKVTGVEPSKLVSDVLLDLANIQGSNRVVEVHLQIGKLRSISTKYSFPTES